LEMAQQLQAQGETVALLVILDHTPPPLRYRRFVWTPTLPFDFVLNSGRWVIEDIWHVGRGRRLDALRRCAKAASRQLGHWLWRPREATGKHDVAEIFDQREFPAEFRRVLEAHYQAMREYRAKSYTGRILLFRARTRPLLRLHGRDLGWRQIAAGGLEIITIPGNHETMLKPPHVGVLAQALSTRLHEEQRRRPAH
jgi:thioesterase domain-containing protein